MTDLSRLSHINSATPPMQPNSSLEVPPQATKESLSPATSLTNAKPQAQPQAQSRLEEIPQESMSGPAMLSFLGEGEPTEITTSRLPLTIAPKETKIFSTGDPWVVLHSDPRNKTINVTLSETTTHPFDYETRLIEALETCWAARENGAEHITLKLPANLDPETHTHPLCSLMRTLAESLGISEISYSPSTTLDDAAQAQIIAPQPQATAASPEGENHQPPHPRHVVFAGSANPQLGRDIVTALDHQGYTAEVVPHTYNRNNSETNVNFEANLHDCTVTITLSTRPDPDSEDGKHYHSSARYLIESLLLAKKAIANGAKCVQLAIAYQPSARSDKRETTAPNFAGAYAAMVARFCESIKGIKKVILLETHDRHTESYFTNANCQGTHVPGLLALARRFVSESGSDNTILVAPDDGAVKRTKALATELGIPMISAHKNRNGHGDNNATVSAINGGQTLDTTKNYFLTDDETATGGTLRQVLRQLREQGAQHITAAIAHNNMPLDPWARHLCLAALIQSGAEKVQFLDTQPMGKLSNSVADFESLAHRQGKSDEDLRAWLGKNVFKREHVTDSEITSFKQHFNGLGSDKLEVISAAPLLAEAIAPKATI